MWLISQVKERVCAGAAVLKVELDRPRDPDNEEDSVEVSINCARQAELTA